jgi:ferredoxin-thioredoxin reductase catalytic subunit
MAWLYAFLKSSEHAAKQAAEKQAANPAPDKDVHVEALRTFTRVEDEWKSGAWGYCRDCRYTTGQVEVTSYLCNGCTKAQSDLSGLP